MRLSRPFPWLLAIVALILVGGIVLYANRWQISRRAVAIADPSVRAWAAREVARLSEGSYRLSASIIKVDEARRRIAIDTITVETDSTANNRRAIPLPTIALRFDNCAIEGIDLNQLTAGRGLHATHMGCDSVALLADVPPAQAKAGAARENSHVSFLNFTQTLNLPRNLPVITLDTIAFPQVRLVLSIAGNAGRRTNISFDRLGMRFDSLRYQRSGHDTKDRVLLSRDVRVSLERFEGNREMRNRVSLKLLSANLVRGTLRLDSLMYAPLPGPFADSLGVKALQVGHLALDGVDWRRFLTSGDIRVGTLTLNTALVRLPYRSALPATPAAKRATPSRSVADQPAPSLEMVLRTLSRRIHLDTLNATNLTFIDEGRTPRDNSTTSVASVSIRDVAFDDADSSWESPFPIGRVVLRANGVAHTWDGQKISLDSVNLDANAATISGGVFRFGPQGSEEDFQRRIPYRQDPVRLSVGLLSLRGLDIPEYLRHTNAIVRHASLERFNLDVLSDRRKPRKPGKPSPHRTPQQFVQNIGFPIRADTITVQGALTYREQDSSATSPGVLSFSRLAATLIGFHTRTGTAPGDSLPLHIIADARLMGVGATHLDIILPLQAQAFQMRFKGSIGGMPADSLNSFLTNSVGVRFTSGQIESIRFDAIVDQGRARGMLIPRWKALGIALPGVAHRSGGLIAGVRRAVAGFAANAFVVRSNNVAPGEVRDGTIDQRWDSSLTLPAFIWLSLRGALLPLLQK